MMDIGHQEQSSPAVTGQHKKFETNASGRKKSTVHHPVSSMSIISIIPLLATN